MTHRPLPAPALCLALACVSCDRKPPPAPAAAPLWSEDVAASLARARAQNKDVLLNFSGSDWAPWSAALDREVFGTAAFKAAAPASFVLVNLDFPQKSAKSAAVTGQNVQWLQKCGIGGFPTVILADSSGRPYGQLGYLAGGPESYLRAMDALRARRAVRDQKLAAAARVQGAERAVLIDDALNALGDAEIVLRHYGAEIREVVALDPSGLAKGHYERMANDLQADKKMREILDKVSQAPGKAVDRLVVLASADNLSRPVRQRAMLYAFRVCQLELKDPARAEKILDAALAADPDSETTARLRAGRDDILAGRVDGKPNAPDNFVELRK
jgi:hypothetical protein